MNSITLPSSIKNHITNGKLHSDIKNQIGHNLQSQLREKLLDMLFLDIFVLIAYPIKNQIINDL